MAKKDFTIDVRVRGDAECAAITNSPYGLYIDLQGVDSSFIVGLVTPEEIAEEVNLEEILQALVAKHGLWELVTTLVENNITSEILEAVYDTDDDGTRDWATDRFSDNE